MSHGVPLRSFKDRLRQVALFELLGLLLIGYVALSRFVTTQIAWMTLVFSLLMLLTMLTDELTTAWFRREGMVGSRLIASVGFAPRSLTQLGVVFNGVVRLLLLGLALLAVFAPWGYDSNSVIGSFRQLLIGFTIGAITISPVTILTAIAVFIVGLVATRAFQRWLDTPIMRLMDMMMALPSLLLAVAVVAVIGPGLANTTIAIAIVTLPAYVRLTRAAALGELQREYVVASRMAGAGTLRLMFSTVLPNCAAPLIVQATLSFSVAILDAAALGFLGLGVQPPLAEWGSMLASARDYMESAWWIVTLPGLAIVISVLAINLVGDGLRDVTAPENRT